MKRSLLLVFIICGMFLVLLSCGTQDNNVNSKNDGDENFGEITGGGKYYSLSNVESLDFYMRTEYPEYDLNVTKIKLFFDRKDRNSFKFDDRYLIYIYEYDAWKKIAFDDAFVYGSREYEIIREDPSASDVSEMVQTIYVRDWNVELKAGRYRVQKEFEDGSVYAEFIIK